MTKTSKSTVRTLDQLLADDVKERMKLTETYHDEGFNDKVRYVKGKPAHGTDQYSEMQAKFNNIAKRNPSSVKHKINQLMRLSDPSTDKEHLIIQGGSTCIDAAGNKQEYSFTLGRYQNLGFKHIITGFSPVDGSPLESQKVIDSFEDYHTITFSEEQVKAIQPHFAKQLSLLIKDAGGRKWSCESLSQFVGDQSAALNRLTPKVIRKDNSN